MLLLHSLATLSLACEESLQREDGARVWPKHGVAQL